MSKKRKTNREFAAEVYKLFGNEYTLLEDYKGSTKKIKIRHNVCGRVYYVFPTNLLRGYRCNHCQAKKAIEPYKVKQAEFENRFNKLLGSDYRILTKYQNVRTKVKVKHLTCGYEYYVLPTNIYAGHKCPKCTIKEKAKKLSKSSIDYSKEFYNLVGSEYTLLTPYTTKRTKIKVRHNLCGNIYEVFPLSFTVDGARCNRCNSLAKSKGEQLISDLLNSFRITCEEQKEFSWLYNDRLLRYDFYLPNCNVALEIDGIQHREPISYFGGIEEFKNIHKRDIVKDRLSKEHGIKVIRLQYKGQKYLSLLSQEFTNLVTKNIIY